MTATQLLGLIVLIPVSVLAWQEARQRLWDARVRRAQRAQRSAWRAVGQATLAERDRIRREGRVG